MRNLILAAVAALALGAPVGAEAKSDPWITMKAKLQLLTSPDVDGTQVNVDTVRGVVTLHGKVETRDEADRAAELARGIEGVREVRNLIQVVPDTTKKSVRLDDETLKKNVKADLQADPMLAEGTIHVQSVNKGVVLLGGDAKSLSQHRRAIEVARREPGVVRVESQIKSPNEIADEEIWQQRDEKAEKAKSKANDMWLTTAVKMKLLANDQTPGMSINVDTYDGTVTLFGMVPTDGAKKAAEAEASGVEGVRTVVNDLQVVPEEKKETVAAKDEDIQSAVQKAIKDDADLADADIKVEVKNGVVRLTGTTASYGDRLTAAIDARTVSGVRSVSEDLRVNPKKQATN